MPKKMNNASFRDPSGFVYIEDKIIYRQVNQNYKDEFDHLLTSGLYQKLVECGWLISHQEVSLEHKKCEEAYRIIKPEPVNFISYPYEWCFSQLKDAALLTLKIQKTALSHGMSLKDASAFNIQFHKGKPILIDTLSFEKQIAGKPWVAYRQFCQHFLAPLALMSYRDARLNQLWLAYIDGLPLDLTSRLLSWASYLNPGLLLHIHLHARSQKKYASESLARHQNRKVKPDALPALIDNLEQTVSHIKWKPGQTEWSEYYIAGHNYSSAAFEHKKRLVAEWLNRLQPKNVWDYGANTGAFSHISGQQGVFTLSLDVDPLAVEKNYISIKQAGVANILPLVFNLTNPSPAIGWHNQERATLWQRGSADVALALALVHHLVIGNNLPLDHIADFFSQNCAALIVEFIPKSDSQVQRLLASRPDIFHEYNQKNFEEIFSRRFVVKEIKTIEASQRTLYLMIKKS